jgi:hypothetical protein
MYTKNDRPNSTSSQGVSILPFGMNKSVATCECIPIIKTPRQVPCTLSRIYMVFLFGRGMMECDITRTSRLAIVTHVVEIDMISFSLTTSQSQIAATTHHNVTSSAHNTRRLTIIIILFGWCNTQQQGRRTHSYIHKYACIKRGLIYFTRCEFTKAQTRNGDNTWNSLNAVVPPSRGQSLCLQVGTH